MVDLATKMLLHDKVRFSITLIGVAFAVTLVFVQVGLFLGLLDNATITIDQSRADIWVTSKNTPNIDFSHTFSENHVQRIRSIPGVVHADNLIITWMDVALPTGAKESTVIYALEDPARWNLPWKVMEGTLEDLRRGSFVFVDDSAKKRFGPFSVGQYREYLGHRVKIIGRTKEALSFTTAPLSFMDYRLAQSLNQEYLRGKTTYILVQTAPGANIQAVREEIQRRLPYNDVYTKTEWADRSRDYWISNTGLGFNMFLTVFLGALVGLVIVAQTLYTSTMEHLREFGTVKAIGGSNLDIYRIISKQAAIAACLGFVLGAIPSIAVSPLIEKAVDLRVLISPVVSVLIFFGTLIMCLSASMISFKKVAGIEPAMVFRT